MHEGVSADRAYPFTQPFAEALRDYRLLLDRGYPERGSLQLVGDRHRLTGEQRTAIYRGACAAAVVERRQSRLFPVGSTSGECYIDGYNVIFVILNYRLGHPVFVCDDGFVRDAGRAHGRIARTELLEEAARVLCDAVRSLGSAACAYLDRPVSGSLRHAALIRRTAADRGAQLRCELVDSADRALAQKRAACIATSDSAVIDRHAGTVVDLARFVLESAYDAELPDLAELR